MLSGNVFNTLMNIDAIGDDLDMNQAAGCGKAVNHLCRSVTAARILEFRNVWWEGSN